jgi:hypothetical protein
MRVGRPGHGLCLDPNAHPIGIRGGRETASSKMTPGRDRSSTQPAKIVRPHLASRRSEILGSRKRLPNPKPKCYISKCYGWFCGKPDARLQDEAVCPLREPGRDRR